ncbi:hypothetical protein CYMTET_9750, partial [Cymbomonas tetramitiformis]
VSCEFTSSAPSSTCTHLTCTSSILSSFGYFTSLDKVGTLSWIFCKSPGVHGVGFQLLQDQSFSRSSVPSRLKRVMLRRKF